MKIYIDINHPAHVHYFKFFIREMTKKGHSFVISNRNDKMINRLLDIYDIKHYIRNARPVKKNLLSSLLYLLGMILYIIKFSFSNQPDLYLGFGSSPCAIVSFLFRKPCVILDDTEHNSINHKLYKPFANSILTPYYFYLTMSTKQIFFNAYVEQLYLHSSLNKENNKILRELRVKEKEFVLVRYIAYDARHDCNVSPLSLDKKKELILYLEKRYKVIVSLEKSISDSFFDKYIYNFSPDKMHDIIKNAAFIITEGATMASEAFVLGIPYIYINPLNVGNVNDQISMMPNFAHHVDDFKSIINIIDGIKEIDNKDNIKEIEGRTINPTNFLIWFIENYPKSHSIMKSNPDYQYKFK